MKTFKELTEEIRLDESAGNTVFTLADFKKIPISGRPGHDMKPTYSVNANYVRIDISTLGGQHRPILGIKLSLDDKEDWENGIYQNSRFLILSLDWQGVLEEDARGSGLSKFRKAKVKSIDEAVKKINDWIRKNS